MIISNVRLRRFLTAVIISLFAAGCMSKTPSDWGALFEKSAADGKRAPGKPVFDVVGQNFLGNSAEVSISSSELVARVSEREESDRWAAASSWAVRHPETALEVLRALDPKTPQDTYLLLAEVHDELTLLPGNPGWTRIAELRKSQPQLTTAYSEARKQFQSRISEGHLDRALEVDLAAKAAAVGSVLLEIDAAQLRGTVLMVADRPRDAAESFAGAAEAALQVCPYQAAYLLLLQSDAERRAGGGQAASQTWQRAIVTAVKLISGPKPVLDPVLWERLGYLRPVAVAWPADVIALLATQAPLPGLATISAVAPTTASDAGADPAEAEATVWHAVGRWYLDRGHAQAGLVSFKRAETSAPSDLAKRWLRLRQAKALVQLEQGGPATAILAGLIGDKKSELYRPASALLGSIYLQRSQSRKGLALLKAAVEQEDGFEWPERSEAEADLALAYLSVGDAVVGLDRMHRAQRRLENDGNRELLSLALDNELKFLEHTGKRKEASVVREKMRELEQSR